MTTSKISFTIYINKKPTLFQKHSLTKNTKKLMIVMFFKLFENAMNKKINIETMSHIIERSDFIQHGQCIYQMFFNIKNPSLSVNFFFKAMGLKK
jgi:hypothetical protein